MADEHTHPGGSDSGRPPVVETRDLCRRFGKRWALARLDLVVHPGERVLLVGANGSGKSTLLNILATLMPPTRGQLRLFGLDPVRDRAAIRRRIGIVRHAHGLYEDLSARDNLAFRARIVGRALAPAAGGVDIAQVLAEVGLDDRIEPIRTYSAGMRKRLQLAALELEGPELVLLDEPFSALDPAGCAEVSRLVRERQGTVLIASHQVERAAAICDRAILLDHGLLRWEGPANRASDAWRMIQAEGAAAARGAASGGLP